MHTGPSPVFILLEFDIFTSRVFLRQHPKYSDIGKPGHRLRVHGRGTASGDNKGKKIMTAPVYRQKGEARWTGKSIILVLLKTVFYPAASAALIAAQFAHNAGA